MIDFQKLDLTQKEEYQKYLMHCGERGCEYSLANLYMWGHQKVAIVQDCMAFYSQYERSSVYPFPIGDGDVGAVLDAIIHDAHTRGIPCYLTCMSKADCDLLETLYPGMFRFHMDRDSFDYIYSIEALAELKGKKLQRKRNHCNRFHLLHPHCTAAPITDENTPQVLSFIEQWYAQRKAADPTASFRLEQIAITNALRHRKALGMEGLVLRQIL